MNRGDVAKRVSAAAILLLCGLEGFRSMPYRDLAGVPTDGYGNTHGVVMGRVVSEPAARAALVAHTDVFGAGVQRCIKRDMTQDQYDAFVLMAYNTGLGKSGISDGFCELRRGGPSTLVRRFNSGDALGACLAMLSWVKVKGQMVQGLINRRWTEYQLCVGGS